MPFNGSGVFQRVRNWVSDAAGGIKIRADFHDNEDDGFAVGLTNCITRDGQTIITQNIPWNNKRITGLADPVNPQDAATQNSVSAIATSVAVPLAGGTMTGPLILSGDPTVVLGASTKQYTDAQAAAAQAAAIAAAAAAGNGAYQPLTPQLFAGIPAQAFANGYVTVATDAQKLLWNSAGGTSNVTINSGLYPVGAVISVFAWGGNIGLFNNAAGGQFWLSPSGPTSGTRVIAQYGLATAVQFAGGYWAISGSGIT